MKYIKSGLVVFFAMLVVFLLQKGYFQENRSNNTDANHISGIAEKDCVAEINSLTSADEATYLGDEYFGGGRQYDLECAETAYYKAIEIVEQGNIRTWHQLGRIDFLRGDYYEAIQKFNNQLKYHKEIMPNVHYMLGLTYGYKAKESRYRGDWEKAEEHFLRYIELDLTSWAARVDLSWLYFAQGKYEEMKPHLEIALENYPQNPWVLNMYGLAILNTEDREEAHEYFLQALEASGKLSIEDWGEAYPGNDPASWSEGVQSMREYIQKNLEITAVEGEIL